MSKSTTFSNDLLKLLFNGAGIGQLASNATSSPATQFWLALHSADPGAAGDQTSSEVSYAGYARMPVLRDATAWKVTGGSVALAANVMFGLRTDVGSVTVTHVSVGLATTGAGKILYSGPVTPVLVVAQGTSPILSQGTVVTES